MAPATDRQRIGAADRMAGPTVGDAGMLAPDPSSANRICHIAGKGELDLRHAADVAGIVIRALSENPASADR